MTEAMCTKANGGKTPHLSLHSFGAQYHPVEHYSHMGSVGDKGFVEWSLASGGSASSEDPPRTSLGKAHGPEGGTQPKEI